MLDELDRSLINLPNGCYTAALSELPEQKKRLYTVWVDERGAADPFGCLAGADKRRHRVRRRMSQAERAPIPCAHIRSAS
jgi:hypothetical protein